MDWKSIVDIGEQVIEWAVRGQTSFIVLFIAGCFFLYKSETKRTARFEKELEESRKERKEILAEHKREREKFLAALAEQQKLTEEQHLLIDKQYELLKSEKRQIDRIENKIGMVDHKLDMMAIAKGKDG